MNKSSITKIIPALALLVAVMAAGCVEERADRDYVQTNVVQKSLFEGEWYYAHTTIDNDNESTYAMAFRGDVSFDAGLGGLGTISRIRFVIDEDFLYAYRTFALTADADVTPEGDRGRDLYEPMAAWGITSHFDIVRRYNGATGEVLNVIEENSQDRPWYERQYMRVNWARNSISNSYNFSYLDVLDPLGYLTRESASTWAQEGSPWPEEFQPQFDSTSINEPDRASWEWEYWDRYGPDQLYHFAFVTQELWNPGVYPIYYEWAQPWQIRGANATSSLVSVRHSFLRVPDDAQYEPMMMPDREWEQFGAWRVEQNTFMWGDMPNEENGLSSYYGETDAKNYWAGRHNIWRRSYNIDDDGRRQPIPVQEREVQPVVYTLTERFPAWLVHTSFDLIGEWNGAMMASVRAARGEEPPATIIEGSSCTAADIESQLDECPGPDCPTPAEYCQMEYGDAFQFSYCRTAHNGGSANCTRHYTPFIGPDSEHWVEGDFDCYVVAADGGAPTDPGLSLGSFEDEALEAQRGWRFTGTECALTLRNNTCDNPEDLARAIEERPACAANSNLCCDQMGDLRFNLLSHINQVGLMFGGISQPLMDPLTGELIQANANVSATSIEGAMTYVGYYFDLVDGDADVADELSMMVGEDVRAMMENSDYAIPPTGSLIPPSLSTSEAPLAGFMDARSASGRYFPRLQHSLEKAWNLRGEQGRAKTFSRRIRNLADTPIERQLLSGPDGMQALGFQPDNRSAIPTQDQLAAGSLFQNGILPAERERQALRNRMAERCMYPAAEDQLEAFVDNSYLNWLRSFPEGTTEQQRAIAVGRSYFRAVMLHEMGHSVGMRHNFAGSLDYHNYHDQFFSIDDQHPLPVADDYDVDESNDLSYEEYAQFTTDLTDSREAREALGVSRWRSASVMEYMPRISNDLQPLGHYDHGFAQFIYGNNVEVYAEQPSEYWITGTGQDRAWILRPDRAARSHQQYFAGGETCRIDRETDTGFPERYHHEDCPYGILWHSQDAMPPRGSACNRDADCAEFDMRCDTARNWCISRLLPEGQVVGQRCAENPRAGQTEHREDLPGVCVGYAEAWDLYATEVGVTDVEVYPISYRFCSDERTADISWCTRFDEGENFQEIMANYRASWVRSYPWYFRRHRADWGGASFFSRFADVAKIMSHFYYRYFYENLYLEEGNAWVDSMYDHLAGAAAGMNWLAEVIAQPEMGSYEYDADSHRFNLVESGVLDADGSDLNIPLGQGRYMWSSYQEGHQGIFRMERQGGYQDKLYALYALARREWGYAYSYDERFWINFYSMFQYEMSQLFGGIILDNPDLYGPRVCETGMEHPFTGETCERDTIFYQNLWRGPFVFDSDYEPRNNPYDEVWADYPSIGGGSNELLRQWAVIFSLAEFPVFYDTTYEQQMYLFIEGTGESFALRECDEYPDEEGCLTEGTDFARYFSDRFNLSFVAMNLERQFDWEPDEINTAYIIVDQANVLQNNIVLCEADHADCPVPAGPGREAALDRWALELERAESFIISVLDIQGEYGIASWL